jgi:hypothetical protein
MTVLLHEGHEHTEAAASTLSTVSSELAIAAAVGMFLGILVLGYAIERRRD